MDTRGGHRFSSLVKQNKKGKKCAVFCFAGKRKIFFIYLLSDYMGKKKKKLCYILLTMPWTRTTRESLSLPPPHSAHILTAILLNTGGHEGGACQFSSVNHTRYGVTRKSVGRRRTRTRRRRTRTRRRRRRR